MSARRFHGICPVSRYRPEQWQGWTVVGKELVTHPEGVRAHVADGRARQAWPNDGALERPLARGLPPHEDDGMSLLTDDAIGQVTELDRAVLERAIARLASAGIETELLRSLLVRALIEAAQLAGDMLEVRHWRRQLEELAMGRLASLAAATTNAPPHEKE